MKNTLQFINREALNDPKGLIAAAEKEYIDNIAAVAKRIAEDDDIKIVSIAGPSGSGKTTTAHILCEKLEQLGEKTAVVSLDDFYLPQERLPVLENGLLDIESVNALDIPLLNECFDRIISTGATTLPKYEFGTGSRIENAREIDIGERGIVIVEGLHALNPLITELIPRRNIFKVYISVNLPITDDGKLLLTSRQMRLVRRSLRDEIFRDADINETLSLWENVVEGERKFLYCHKNSADVQLKTLHLYEPCVFRERFISLRDQLAPDAHCREYFLKTVEAIERFESIDTALVPHESLIREFLGEGKYN